MKKIKIMVGVNTLTQVDQLAYSNHCQFWFRLGRNHPEIEFCLNSPRRASIDRMRNQTAKLALELDFDYVMFIDDDVLIPTDTLAKLLKCDKDIAAGWTIIRGYPYDNMFFKYKEGEESTLEKYNDFVLNEEGLIECDALGFSCVLIKTSLLKKVAPPFFVTGPYNTEDIYFCIKARKAVPDCTIVVDPTVKTAHILGSEVIEPDNRESYKKFFEESYPEYCSSKKPKEDARGDNYLKMIKEPTKENVHDFLSQGA